MSDEKCKQMFTLTRSEISYLKIFACIKINVVCFAVELRFFRLCKRVANC